MTDITELAQSLKAAAIDAKELAIIARYSKGRAAAEKFYALANPNNVIALVEALEKAQQLATQQGNIACALFDEVTALRQRIAELESRTVTVENLQESAYRAGLTAGWNLGLANNNDGFNKCLAAHAAGIKVEAE
ncbi:TPA: hypothetical protein MM128_002509 [Klebsiella pneumoniae]|nr:hypothetical protein [Klebsiella pneumoniae]